MNDEIVVFIVGTIVLLLFTFFIILFLVVHSRKKFQHLLEKQQMESTYENQLLQSKLEVQEQSFRHFSEEIHDNVGQLLSIVKMQLYGIRDSSKEEETVSRATDSTELLGKAINDLRNISHTFNSSYITNVGLAAAIEKELDYIRSAKDIKCSLHLTGEDNSIGNERELLVFRIIQEAVGNALKHAFPSTIDIYLYYQPGSFTVIIADNGVGFDTGGRNSGIGLSNMQIRAGLLNGTIEVNSVKDKGTTIQLTIPNQ